MSSRPARALVVSWLVASIGIGASARQSVDFERDQAGSPPSGFSLAAMRQSTPGAWTVERVSGTMRLVHRSDAAAHGYALAVSDNAAPPDGIVSVRLRLAGGSRAGGVVWRYRDAQNFYAAILDLSRRDLALYRVAEGNRIRLEMEDGLELDSDAWHTLKVTHTSSSMTVSLGGIRVFEENDRRADRTAPVGRAGLIAAGDADVWFDDLRVEPRSDRR